MTTYTIARNTSNTHVVVTNTTTGDRVFAYPILGVRAVLFANGSLQLRSADTTWQTSAISNITTLVGADNNAKFDDLTNTYFGKNKIFFLKCNFLTNTNFF